MSAMRSAPCQGGATVADRPTNEQAESTSCSLLNEHEVERLIQCAVNGHEARGITEAELVTVVRWAERIKVSAALLDLVLEGRAVICEVDGADVMVRAV